MKIILDSNRYVKRDVDPADLQVEKYADRSEVQSGDVYSYRIVVRNTSTKTLNFLEVDDVLDFTRLSIVDIGGGMMTGQGIRWNVRSLNASEFLTFRYSVRVTDNVAHGDVIYNMTKARADDVREKYAYNQVYVVKVMPQTGTLASLPSEERFISPLQNTVGQGVLTLFATIITMGTAAGGIFTRRFL